MFEPFDLSDEQRVALFLAIRLSNPELKNPRCVTYMDIEDSCSKFWKAVGVYRTTETWGRAFRRAKGHGMLGRVEEKRVKGKPYNSFTFDGDLEDILVSVGPGYQMIPHGRRSRARGGRQ